MRNCANMHVSATLTLCPSVAWQTDPFRPAYTKKIQRSTVIINDILTFFSINLYIFLIGTLDLMQLLHLQSQMRALMTNRQLKVQYRRLPGTTCHSVRDVGEKKLLQRNLLQLKTAALLCTVPFGFTTMCLCTADWNLELSFPGCLITRSARQL